RSAAFSSSKARKRLVESYLPYWGVAVRVRLSKTRTFDGCSSPVGISRQLLGLNIGPSLCCPPAPGLVSKVRGPRCDADHILSFWQWCVSGRGTRVIPGNMQLIID